MALSVSEWSVQDPLVVPRTQQAVPQSDFRPTEQSPSIRFHSETKTDVVSLGGMVEDSDNLD